MVESDSFVRAAQVTLEVYRELFPEKRASGALFVLGADGECLCAEPIGAIQVCQRAMRHALARENAERLSRHPEHRTSFESRAPTHERRGGAIRAGAFIISFSGLLSEFADEALSLVVAMECLGLSGREAARTATAGNRYLPLFRRGVALRRHALEEDQRRQDAQQAIASLIRVTQLANEQASTRFVLPVADPPLAVRERVAVDRVLATTFSAEEGPVLLESLRRFIAAPHDTSEHERPELKALVARLLLEYGDTT